MMDLPTQQEQDIAEAHVMRRPLPRPDTTYAKAAWCTAAFLLTATAAALLSWHMLEGGGWFGGLAGWPGAFHAAHPHWFAVCWFALVYLIGAIAVSRAAVIGGIRLYQHYADESIRRRCLCMPTCSEYAILAVRKYGVVIGLFKAYIRLFKKCRGNIYRIDYP